MIAFRMIQRLPAPHATHLHRYLYMRFHLMTKVYYINRTNQQYFVIIFVMDGIILVKKPKGMTSFTCVSQVKRRVNERKAGHSGTLDPNAEGFMIIALGKCTKYLPYCVSNHKHYQATFALGKRYDTQDVWGEAVEEKAPSMHTQEELDRIIMKG